MVRNGVQKDEETVNTLQFLVDSHIGMLHIRGRMLQKKVFGKRINYHRNNYLFVFLVCIPPVNPNTPKNNAGIEAILVIYGLNCALKCLSYPFNVKRYYIIHRF